ncbi:4'-phosphopantetheinyl transferase superfamily protein [Flavobacteriaceae bacterium]|nr:4'-phosphopantetheinyl transferase superfamily protein [Flavobacteriaceae bacterium]
MPICYQEIIGEETKVVIWKITETEFELQSSLSLSSVALQRLSQRKSELHRKGYLAIRQLLKSLGISPKLHQYDKIGAPYLTDGRFISVSHSKDIAAVVISSTSVGIDLEYYKDKIKLVASRFLHPAEFEKPDEIDEIEYLTQIWTAKEALYKLYKKPGLIFSKQLCIKPFKKGSARGKGLVIEKEGTIQFFLNFRRFENYFLTLATIN